MLVIAQANREILHEHAAREFPYECCGVIIGRKEGKPEEDQVRPLTNIQSRLHREDPQAHPRDARIAYQIAPEEFYAVLKEAEQEELEVKAIYHSHPQNPVCFSAEDEEKALVWGEPPCGYYLVMSIYDGEVKEEGAFRWEPSSRTFVREEVRIKP
jgi:proteasome lid subunit RPN8/RPN11